MQGLINQSLSEIKQSWYQAIRHVDIELLAKNAKKDISSKANKNNKSYKTSNSIRS